MKILMICPEFPPVNTTGNYRSAGFAREFTKAGHEVQVITTTIESGEETFRKSTDDQLLVGLESIKIHRYPIKSISKFFSNGIGNAIRIWWNSTDRIDKRWYFGKNKRQIQEVVKRFKPDILYVSLPPFSIARVAIELQAQHCIPLITDMRDAWSLWATSPYSTRFHYKKVKRLERALFNASDTILGVTQQLVDDFKTQHPSVSEDKFHVVFNGYDSNNINTQTEDYNDDLPPSYTIGYIGSFYYDPRSDASMTSAWHKRSGLKKFWYTPRQEFWEYRSPHFFLKAMSLHNHKFPKNKIRFEFVGKEPYWLEPMLDKLQVTGDFKSHSFRSKEEVLQIQQTWDGVLATSEKIEGRPHFCLPSKIFDAIESGKRIIAFVTPGAQMDFLKDYEQTEFFNPDKLEENSVYLNDLIQSENSFTVTPLKTEFFREEQGKLLINLLKQVVN